MMMIINALSSMSEKWQLLGESACEQTTLDFCLILQFANGALTLMQHPLKSCTITGVYTTNAHRPRKLEVRKDSMMSSTNMLEFPRPTEKVSLPPMDRLFALYDLAFSQCWFGKK